MSKRNTSSFDSINFLAPLLLILYLCIGFVPNFQAVDKIAPQWVIMSSLNLVSVICFIFNRKSLQSMILEVFYNFLSLFYVSFILWASLSYYYAINPTETIVNITRQVNVLIMFISMAIFIKHIKNKQRLLSWILTIILTIEIYFVLDQLIELIQTSRSIANRTSLKGIAANPNITAFSIAIKIPFLIYLILHTKKNLQKFFLSFILFGGLICITVIQSRASIIATIGVIIASIILISINKDRITFKKKIYSSSLIILPFLLAIVINQAFLASKGADVVARTSTISITQSDQSINARLRYYSHALEQIKSTPIFGSGLGNWKLKSIHYDSKDISGYVVPYHAHSDFIQLGAELGVIGFFLYIGIFIWAIYYVYTFLRFSKSSYEEKTFVFLLLVALGVYIVDANLNFPIARPQVLVVWALIIALIVGYYQKHKFSYQLLKVKNNWLTPVFLSLATICIIPSLYVTLKVNESLKGQMFLLQDFNSNNYNVPLNQIDNIVPDIPNITVTTIPINSVKARYYVNAKRYDKALALLDKGTNANPYLFYSEILKSQIYQEQGKLDSAKVYAKKAFFGLPNNDLHASRYINLINITRDKKALEEAFEFLTYKNKLVNWKNYLIIASGINNPKDPILIKRAKKATEIFPNNSEIKNLYNQIAVGAEKLDESISYSKTGLEFFNKGDYQNAANEFEKAAQANPLDYAYFENAATANYMIGNLEKAEQQIDVVINDLNPLNGKCEYIKALIYIKMGDPVGACPYLAKARDSGFSQAIGSFDQYCK